jgi:hypothetical protein
VIRGDVTDYTLRGKVGQGGFSWVLEAIRSTDNARLAFKVIKPEVVKRLGLEACRSPEESFQKSGQRHILHLYETIELATEDGPTIAFVMELAGATLNDYIVAARRIRSPEVMRDLVLVAFPAARAAADALLSCQGPGIVCHADIKPSNQFLVDETWKLGDFGLAHMVREDNTHTYDDRWSGRYMAPERQWHEVRLGGDIYSIALCLLEALTLIDEPKRCTRRTLKPLHPKVRALLVDMLSERTRKGPPEKVIGLLERVVAVLGTAETDVAKFGKGPVFNHAEAALKAAIYRRKELEKAAIEEAASQKALRAQQARVAAKQRAAQEKHGARAIAAREKATARETAARKKVARKAAQEEPAAAQRTAAAFSGAPARASGPRRRLRKHVTVLVALVLLLGALSAARLGFGPHGSWSARRMTAHLQALYRDWTGQSRAFRNPRTSGLRPGTSGSVVINGTTHEPPPPTSGYLLVNTDGELYGYGDDAAVTGEIIDSSSSAPVTAIAADPTTNGGYWVLQSDGTVTDMGTEISDFSISSGSLNWSSAVSIAPTPDGGGYWILQTDGNVVGYGDAWALSTGPDAIPSVALVAQAQSQPSSDGQYWEYWVLGSNGGIECPGDNAVCATGVEGTYVAMVGDLSGGGYYLVCADGTVFAEGDASINVSASAITSPLVAVALTRDGSGYWLVSANGAIYAEGDATYYGGANVGQVTTSSPIVGIIGDR